MHAPELTVIASDRQVWRVGYKPEPWAWSGWEWATDGRFGGRWDDAEGNFRVTYAGNTLFSCLVEVLAALRPDPALLSDLEEIEEVPLDATWHPTQEAGVIAYSWLGPRIAGSAHLSGSFCAVTTASSVAALRARFMAQARTLGLEDFDAAALKDARPRILTQSVATHLYTTTELAGVQFASRLGDDLALWAIFERPDEPAISPKLTNTQHHPLSPETPDLAEAFNHLGLRWEDDEDPVP